MNRTETLMTGLETAFSKIQRERMVDVPILNQALAVKAVGFIAWEKYYLGILITPWFMNLMLLPGDEDEPEAMAVGVTEESAEDVVASKDDDEWIEQPTGTKINHVFPSGNYEFIVGEEDSIGHYQMCSLFSPVFEFENQEAAVATAEAVMEGLMDEANRDDVSTRESEIQKIWSGEDETTGADADAEDANRPTLKERIEKPMSRREMLRGAFLGGEERE